MSSTILSERGVRTLPLAADQRGRDGGGRRVIGAAWELCVGTQFLHHSGQLGFMRSTSSLIVLTPLVLLNVPRRLHSNADRGVRRLHGPICTCDRASY